MPAGPIGAKWKPGSWKDTAWVAGSWGSSVAPDTPAPAGGVWSRDPASYLRVWRYDPVDALPTETKGPLIACVSDDRDYIFDASRAPEILEGQTIVSGVIVGGAGLTIGTPTVLAEDADDVPAFQGLTVRISGGVAETVYALACKIALNSGRTVTVPGRLKKVADYAT